MMKRPARGGGLLPPISWQVGEEDDDDSDEDDDGGGANTTTEPTP